MISKSSGSVGICILMLAACGNKYVATPAILDVQPPLSGGYGPIEYGIEGSFNVTQVSMSQGSRKNLEVYATCAAAAFAVQHKRKYVRTFQGSTFTTVNGDAMQMPFVVGNQVTAGRTYPAIEVVNACKAQQVPVG